MGKGTMINASQNGKGRNRKIKIQDTKSSRFVSDLVTHTKYAG